MRASPCHFKKKVLIVKQEKFYEIPIYYHYLFRIPISVSKSTKTFMGNFSWETEEGGGCHLIRWDLGALGGCLKESRG